MVGTVGTPEFATEVAVQGDVAYLTSSSSGLLAIDVSDPTDPVLLGSVATPGAANSVAVVGDLAYVVDDVGLHVIDVLDPESPVILGSIDVPFASRVAVVGSVAYLTTQSRLSCLHVIDVSNPEVPVTLGSVQLGGLPGLRVSVAVSGTLAFAGAVIDGFYGFRVIDVSDSANPVIIGSMTLPHHPGGIAVSGTLAYMTGFSGFWVIDVSQPTAPIMIGSIPFGTDSGSDVVVDDAMVYATLGFEGLLAIDASDPARPKIVGALDTPGWAFRLTIDGTLVYVASSPPPGEPNGLQVIDVSSCTGSCPADLNADGTVGVDDLVGLVLAWGTPDADLTGDGMTNVSDLIALITTWGPCE